MEFKDRLKELRRSIGLTQKELAHKAGLAVGTIQQYELGKRRPSYDAINKLDFAFSEYIPEGERYDILRGVTLTEGEAAEIFEHYYDRPELSDGANLQENTLLDAFRNLNDDGKRVAVERVEELSEMKRYQKSE